MAVRYRITYTDQAMLSLDAQYQFLKVNFSHKSAENLIGLLIAFENRVSRFPLVYPVSEIFQGCRKATIHENIAVIYRIKRREIEVLDLVDLRSSRS